LRRRLLVLVSLLAVFGTVPTAEASQTCASDNFYFDGFDTRSLTTFGAMATINTRPGALCTGGTGAGVSGAWAMVANNYFNNSGGYAQSGYISVASNVTARYFSQWVKYSGQTPVTVWGNNASGSVQYYTTYHFDTGHLYMVVAGTTFDSTTFDPAAGVWSSPWDSQYYGETHHPGDDMPGTVLGHDTFSVIRYISSRTSGWVTVPSGVSTTSGVARYHFSGGTSTFDIWTQ
jgi:hypothetical protein